MHLGSVHIDFGKHWKRNIISEGTELLDRGLGLGLLCSELIAWKAQQDKSSIAKLFVERLKRRVLVCENAFACNVDNQQHRAAILI